MNVDWLKKSPGTQIFILFFLLFIGMIVGSLLILILFHTSNAYLAFKLIISSVFIFLFPVLVCTYFLKLFSFQTFFDSSINLLSCTLAFLLLLVSVPLIEYCSKLSSMISFESFAPQVQQYFDVSKSENLKTINLLFANRSIYTLILNIIAIALTPAIVEEFFFRGCLQTTISRFFKSYHVTIWIVAVIFSLFHLQIEGCITRVLLGALLGYLFYYSKNLVYSMIFHFFNNGIIALLVFRYGATESAEMNILTSLDNLSYWGSVLCSILLIICVLYIFKRVSLRNAS